MHNPSASQTHTWSSMMGDYIGMESCVDLEQDEQVVADGGCSDDEYIRRRCCGKRERLREARREKEYPPPIPLLARTENQQPHMPWVLKRYYSGDGRLIIREEKVKHHEYFRVHRSNGRLTLQLVPLDDEVFLPLSPLVGDDEEEREDNNVESNQDQDDDDECEVGIVDGGDEISKDRTVEEAVTVTVKFPPEPTAVESTTVVVGGGGGGKWYNYSSVRSNPCMYGMPVPAIRPVHI